MATVAMLMVCAVTAQETLDTRKQYCGNRLRNKLLSLCGGMYNKRWVLREPSGVLSEAGRALPGVPPCRRAGPRSWRRRRGIVQECCHRGCTIRELNAYCMEDIRT